MSDPDKRGEGGAAPLAQSGEDVPVRTRPDDPNPTPRGSEQPAPQSFVHSAIASPNDPPPPPPEQPQATVDDIEPVPADEMGRPIDQSQSEEAQHGEDEDEAEEGDEDDEDDENEDEGSHGESRGEEDGDQPKPAERTHRGSQTKTASHKRSKAKKHHR
jgi:hypothetical protein